MWLFALLALCSVCYMCYGFTITSSVVSSAMSTPAATLDSLVSTDAKTVWNSMAVISGSLSIIVFLCTGLPLMLIFSLFAWRNSVGVRRAMLLQREAQAFEADDWDMIHEPSPE
jgi:hypothetical protein